MPRTLTSTALNSILAQDTSEEWIVLLTISHSSLTDPIRLALSQSDVVSRSNTYQGFAFRVHLPQQRDTQPPQVQLEVDNVDRQLVDAIRSIPADDASTVRLEIVLSSALDTVQYTTASLTLRGTSWNRLVIRGTLSYEQILREPFPAILITPQSVPASF